MGLLDGHRAVVTGGGSGIGAQTCRRMAGEGAQVAVFDLDAENAEKVAKEIDGLSYAVDVTDFDALAAAMVDAADSMGGLSLLYNNAGGSSLSPIHDYDVAEWRRIVDLNLTGVFHGFKAGAPLIMRNGGGAIVSTASISGTRPAAGEAPYAAAKAAVVALTASAALEYAPTIRVNAVSPGMIRTPLTELLLDRRGIGLEDDQRGEDSPRPDRHARRHRRRRRVLVLGSGPLRHGSESRGGRRNDPARLRRRRRPRRRARSPLQTLTPPSWSAHNRGRS